MKTLKLNPGKYGYARKPILHLNDKGKPYLWIGNNDENPLCYATFSGPKSMEKFAKAILASLKKRKKRKKTVKSIGILSKKLRKKILNVSTVGPTRLVPRAIRHSE